MPHPSRSVAASLFALALAGCDALRGVGELEQAIAREQAAITAYSAAVPEADRLAAVFAEALGRAREHAARRVYREDLAAHAMPAGKAWVEALRAMPGQDSAELAGLHTPLVSAADGLVAALAAVVATGDDAGPEAFAVREADVEARLLALREAEGRYSEALALYCARNRANLAVSRVPLAPAADTAGGVTGEADSAAEAR